MKPISKSKVYAELKHIKDNYGIDIQNQMKLVAFNATIPIETIIFINKYRPIEQFYTYNKIYENRRKNPLYKNLVNENLNDYEKAIALSSLVTQTFIHNKNMVRENKDDNVREFYIDSMNLDVILDALSSYGKGETEKLNEVFFMTRDVFKRLF